MQVSRQVGSVTKRLVTGVLLLGGATFCAVAQNTPDSFSIRVESNQVLVPVFVYHKRQMRAISSAEERCLMVWIDRFQVLRPDEPLLSPDCDDTVFRDLTAKDFRLLEDDAQQTIQSATFERFPVMEVRDNWGDHTELSWVPRGKWSTADLQIPKMDIHQWKLASVSRVSTFYRLVYTPPKSQEGSCHRVKVVVDRPDSFVFARNEYCNVKNAPEDPTVE